MLGAIGKVTTIYYGAQERPKALGACGVWGRVLVSGGVKVKDIPQGNSMCKLKGLRAHGLYEKLKIVWFNLKIMVMEGREMRNENKWP